MSDEEDHHYHYESKLCSLWGRETLNTLRLFVKTGEIDANILRNLAQNPKVMALPVYDEYRHVIGVLETFERILEFWVNQRLFRYQPEEAQALLVDVLTKSCCTPKVIEMIKSKMTSQPDVRSREKG